MTRLLQELSRVQIDALPFERTVVVVPISPLEEHGPHLPVGTDLLISESMAQELACRAEGAWPGVEALITPVVPLGAYAVRGPGSVSIRQRGLHDVLFDFVRGLARSRFRYVVLLSAHGSIEHFIVLEEVAERALKELQIRVEPALSRVVLPFLLGRYTERIEQRLGRSLSEEERLALRSDCHGGQWETGAILRIRPDLVDPGYQRLPPILMKHWLRLRECMTDSCARELGYVGSPAHASVDYAEAAADVLLEIALERVDRLLHDPQFKPSHTPFYYAPFYRTPTTYGRSSLVKAAVAALAAGSIVGVAAGFAAAWVLSSDRKK